jgi:hypothetical protein
MPVGTCATVCRSRRAPFSSGSLPAMEIARRLDRFFYVKRLPQLELPPESWAGASRRSLADMCRRTQYLNRSFDLIIKRPMALNRHWASSKKTLGLSHFCRLQAKQAKQQKFWPNEPGGSRERFFGFNYYIYVTLRFRLRYV